MPKTLVFIDLDVTVRHFVKSGAFRELERDSDVTYVLNVDATGTKGVNVDIPSLGLGAYEVVDVPRKRVGGWYFLWQATALRNHRGRSNYAARRALVFFVNRRRIAALIWLLSQPLIFHLYRWFVRRRQGVYPPLDALIARHAPDVIVYPSVLSGTFMDELLTISKHRGIPLVVLMNSWDNPSTRAAASGVPDYLVVWGEQTRQHAIEYMHLPPDRVRGFGAAQFQIYRHPPKESRAEIRRAFGLPVEGPVLLYGASSVAVNDTALLTALDEAIERGDLPPVHVLYRPHPWAGGRRVEGDYFYDRVWKHVSMDPTMAEHYKRESESYSGVMFQADYTVTHKLLHAIDALLTPRSTIALEARLLGKPVLLLTPMGLRDHVAAYGQAHFREFSQAPGVEICDDESEIVDSVRRVLAAAEDPQIREQLIESSRFFVEMDGPTYGERVATLVREIAGTAVAGPAAEDRPAMARAS